MGAENEVRQHREECIINRHQEGEQWSEEVCKLGDMKRKGAFVMKGGKIKWSETSVPVSKGKQRTGSSEGGLWGRKHQETQKMR